jgi:tetratricopeptide (TPR) repeat protein
VDIYLRFTGNSKIKGAHALANMGAVYRELEDKDKARDCWERALNIYRAAPAELQNKHNMARIQQNISDLAY